jgi:sugar lactone lactonase YvrE
VYGGAVTRFLGGSLRGVVSRVIKLFDAPTRCSGIAVSGDGAMLLVSPLAERRTDSHVTSICAFRTADGSELEAVAAGTFKDPQQLCVAPDGFVFVADTGHHRVQVLSPDLSAHSVIGEGQLRFPVGVCANADVVVVSDMKRRLVFVFRRSDGGVVGCIGDDELLSAHGVCFMCDGRRVAVADAYLCRVSVFDIDGSLVRHIGEGVLNGAVSVACSAFDELVVADRGNYCVRVFSDVGDVLMTFGSGGIRTIAIHESVVYGAVFGTGCTMWS